MPILLHIWEVISTGKMLAPLFFLFCSFHTDNFNGYLALSNFSNFTTNTHGTPNTRFFMGTMVQIAPHQLHVFYLSILKNANYPFFSSQFWKKNMKKRVFGVPCVFVVKLEKLDNAKYPLKLSVHDKISKKCCQINGDCVPCKGELPFVTTACLYLLLLYMYCVDRIYFLFFNVCSSQKILLPTKKGKISESLSLWVIVRIFFYLTRKKYFRTQINSVLLKNSRKGSAIQ